MAETKPMGAAVVTEKLTKTYKQAARSALDEVLDAAFADAKDMSVEKWVKTCFETEPPCEYIGVARRPPGSTAMYASTGVKLLPGTVEPAELEKHFFETQGLGPGHYKLSAAWNGLFKKTRNHEFDPEGTLLKEEQQRGGSSLALPDPIQQAQRDLVAHRLRSEKQELEDRDEERRIDREQRRKVVAPAAPPPDNGVKEMLTLMLQNAQEQLKSQQAQADRYLGMLMAQVNAPKSAPAFPFPPELLTLVTSLVTTLGAKINPGMLEALSGFFRGGVTAEAAAETGWFTPETLKMLLPFGQQLLQTIDRGFQSVRRPAVVMQTEPAASAGPSLTMIESAQARRPPYALDGPQPAPPVQAEGGPMPIPLEPESQYAVRLATAAITERRFLDAWTAIGAAPQLAVFLMEFNVEADPRAHMPFLIAVAPDILRIEQQATEFLIWCKQHKEQLIQSQRDEDRE